MNGPNEVVYWILSGFAGALAYILIEQTKNSKQIAVLQKSVDELASTVKLFLKTETDVLKELIERTAP